MSLAPVESIAAASGDRGGPFTKSLNEQAEEPNQFCGNLCSVNLAIQKQRFLQFGISPMLRCVRQPIHIVGEKLVRQRAEVRTDLFNESLAILSMVKSTFGDGAQYLEATYGPKINSDEATSIIKDVLAENGVDGRIRICWSEDLVCR